MQQAMSARTPAHLWIVGALSLLWNAFGCYDYVMTRMRNTDYLANAMPGVDPNATLAWIDAMPMLVQIGWALGVWLGLLGAVLLLMRSRYAVWSFGISLVGAVISLGYQIALAPPLAGADSVFMKAMPFVIILIAAFLFWYAWNAEKKGLLR